MDWVDKFFLTVILALATILFVLIINLPAKLEEERNAHIDAKRLCESKGGIYLEHTYRSGIVTDRYYTCARKDAIIEME
jgi:hypothetical protein